MGKYDLFDSSSDIMDALDSAEARAYEAETALAEVAETGATFSPADLPFSWARLGRVAMGKVEAIAAGGAWAYGAYTIFSQKDESGKEVPHMPELFGVGADAWSGIALSAAAFFGKIPFLGKLPTSALSHLDNLGTGSLVHWSVVAAQRAGAATLGIDIRDKVGGSNDNGGARTGGSPAPESASAPANSTPVENGKDDPAAYMTPAQKKQWLRFQPRAKKAA